MSGERDAAFSEFVRARRTHLRRVAYAICGDWDRAEDLLQTALAKLYVAWPRIHRDGAEEAYVPAREPLAVEERTALFDALQALPTMQRKVVVLRHWLGLSVEETARELRISAGTVKSHSSRGLEKLQAVLTRQ